MSNELNDAVMIQKAKAFHVSAVEPLYWKLEDDLHDGRIEKASSSYNAMLYIAAYNKKVIAKGLRPVYRDRLKEIAYELHGNGEYIVKRGKQITIRHALAPRDLPFEKEHELQSHLAENPDILSEALGDRIEIRGIEVETDFDYRCDIVARSDTTFYPIELKIGQATHQVVSQINKYCWYFYRKMRYGYFKPIQGVVVANGLDSWSINEIRKDGHWCFTINPTGGKIKLDKVD